VSAVSYKVSNAASDSTYWLVTGTHGEDRALSALRIAYRQRKHRGSDHHSNIMHMTFNASLAIKPLRTNATHVTAGGQGGAGFDYVLHLVSDPLNSIEQLSLSENWVAVDAVLPQLYARPSASKLQQALAHWVAVNQLLEMYADDRIRVEELGTSTSHAAQTVREAVGRVPAMHTATSLTWAALEAEDKVLARVACKMAVRYGYQCKQ
jgi:hypothetical protein